MHHNKILPAHLASLSLPASSLCLLASPHPPHPVPRARPCARAHGAMGPIWPRGMCNKEKCTPNMSIPKHIQNTCNTYNAMYKAVRITVNQCKSRKIIHINVINPHELIFMPTVSPGDQILSPGRVNWE
jgi:hypothetical protein